MEGRMTVCNMAIEAGARVGMVSVDEKTIEYVKGRDFAPRGNQWDAAVAYWQTLHSDEDAVFNITVELQGEDIEPQVSWGTSPEMVLPISGSVPSPGNAESETERAGINRALEYMGLEAGIPINKVTIDKVFIGSCTNSRIEDMRAAAAVVKGRKKSDTVSQALVVPGSGLVKQQAEAEGLNKIFEDAGFEWREPGCSMCLAMNPDKLKGRELSASSSNRNFKGRQGSSTGRTLLMSPAMVAAAAIRGEIADAREVFDVK